MNGVITEWIVGGGMLAIFTTVIGNMWSNNKAMKEFRDNNEGKIGRVYARIDEVKAANDKKYVMKDVCHVHVDVLESDIKEIKTDVKELLRRNGGN